MVKIKNVILFASAIFLLLFFFLSGKEKSVISVANENTYIAPENIYYNIQKIISQQKAPGLDSIFRNLNKKGLFNGTVIYGENGAKVFENAYGYSDCKKKTPLTVQSAFQLASVSKMFTATAIMILHEKGKLNYDDLVTRFIPEFPVGDVTIRELLNHRSGLSNYMSLADQYWDTKVPLHNEDMIDLFAKYKPNSYFKAGKGFHYCNTNYALLASIVERITKIPFEEFIREQIFNPLKMDHSFIYCLKDSVVNGYVTVGVPGYKSIGRHPSEMEDFYLNGVVGDKGVYSTVEDLFRFSVALDNESLVKMSTLEEAFSPGSPERRNRRNNYGFGWRIKSDMDSTVYHFGWWKGFRTYFIRDMRNDRVIIALTNTQRGLSANVLWDIIQEEQPPDKLVAIYRELK